MRKIFKRICSPKFKPSNLCLSCELAVNPNIIVAKWSESQETANNFGDALNPWLIEKLTGRKPINIKNIFNISRKPVYSVIGSTLDNNQVKELTIWGSGFKYENSLLKSIPNTVCAVRGPLTRRNLVRQGISCPEVYGDPALLLPRIYNPKIEKKYRLGIIPHYVDKNHPHFRKLSMNLDSDITVIDIESEIENVIDKILSCELIASSSLHGLIVADAYNIPSLFIKFSNNVVGGNFKFRDYMHSVGRVDMEPLEITKQISTDDVIDNFTSYKIEIDLEKLFNVCPFGYKL